MVWDGFFCVCMAKVTAKKTCPTERDVTKHPLFTYSHIHTCRKCKPAKPIKAMCSADCVGCFIASNIVRIERLGYRKEESRYFFLVWVSMKKETGK